MIALQAQQLWCECSLDSLLAPVSDGRHVERDSFPLDLLFEHAPDLRVFIFQFDQVTSSAGAHEEFLIIEYLEFLSEGLEGKHLQRFFCRVEVLMKPHMGWRKHAEWPPVVSFHFRSLKPHERVP